MEKVKYLIFPRINFTEEDSKKRIFYAFSQDIKSWKELIQDRNRYEIVTEVTSA